MKRNKILADTMFVLVWLAGCLAIGVMAAMGF